ncbi:MAG: hypothetical protein AAGD25_13600 [Cyanobacteria bacterium P01_F01_bin.150]
MPFQLTRKRIVKTVLIGTLVLGVGSVNMQPAIAQLSRSEFRELAQELDLSRSQMRDVAGTMRGFKSEVEDILTPEQLDLLQSAQEQQQSDPQAAQEVKDALNLTDAQSTQLEAAREDMVAELQEVLTPDQVTQIIEMMAFSQI